MKLGIGLGITTRRRRGVVIDGDWLLDGGVWSDTGVWDDTATWSDAA